MGSTPQRLQQVEELLTGKSIDEASIAQAEQLASQAVGAGAMTFTPAADYRKSLVGTLTARALRSAMTR